MSASGLPGATVVREQAEAVTALRDGWQRLRGAIDRRRHGDLTRSPT
jgi:hypothetical protein